MLPDVRAVGKGSSLNRARFPLVLPGVIWFNDLIPVTRGSAAGWDEIIAPLNTT